MMTPGSANALLLADAGYQIQRSVRLRSGATAYLNRTPASAGNRKTWTWSGWVKRGALGTTQSFFVAGYSTSPWFIFQFQSSNKIEIAFTAGVAVGSVTSAVYRDSSAWYHLTLAVDTAQATAANRVKLYVNGVEQSFGSTNYPAQNTDTQVNNTVSHLLGGYSGEFFDGYLTDINFIDGQALTPAAFGEINPVTGVWSAKKYAGTYGTNGFFLNFSDNSAATAAAIGKDSSGNGNNWTPSGISVTAGVTYDSMLDVPLGAGGPERGNYAVLNPLDKNYYTTQAAPLDANMRLYGSGGRRTTVGIITGKWYAEFTLSGGGTPSSNFPAVGLRASADNGYWCGYASNSVGYQQNGTIYYDGNTVSQATGQSFTTGDVLSLAYDADTGKVWFAKNGAWIGTSFPDPATGTSPVYTFPSSAERFIAGDSIDASYGGLAFNMGQRPFAYTPPTGFKALHTGNLPEPVIKQGGKYMAATTYTGAGGTQSITGVGFQPDFVWMKIRSSAANMAHILQNSVTGVTKGLSSNSTGAEFTDATILTSFDADGFTVGGNIQTNNSGSSYVAWQWKANGAAVSNTAGSITSQVSAGVSQGFSVVTYTGNATSGATVGHGLGASIDFMIIKNRGAVASWIAKHKSLPNYNTTAFLELNATAAVDNATGAGLVSSSTTFTLNNSYGTQNANTNTYVAYCFSEVAGYSKFGSYTGNGSADGPFVYTGFRPRFVLTKRSDSTSSWYLRDTSRSLYNAATEQLYPDLSNAEANEAGMDVLSNGFKQRGTSSGFNTSGGTYIYAAFAEHPFKNSLAR